MTSTPADVVDWWREAGDKGEWFAHRPAFDHAFRYRFPPRHQAFGAGGILTLPAFGRAYGFKPHALRRAVKLGLIPAYTRFGKKLCMRPDEVLGYIAACESGVQK